MDDKLRLSRNQLEGLEAGKKFKVGEKIYQIAGKIGDGAIGVVRKAVDLDTGKMVAVKFLAPEPKYIDEDSIEDIYRRFKREGERGIGLSHYNLVEIISYQENTNAECFIEMDGSSPSNPFIIMEFVQGRTLEAFIKKEKTIPRKCFHITRQTLYIAYCITQALQHLHQRGIVHRDIKPANIFLSKTQGDELPNTVKLGDFGIVKWGDYKAPVSTGTLTMTGHANLGTLKYMPPEQSLDPKNVDVKSDMYSLGITLFELFTNQILADVHHVFNVREVRSERGSIDSKLFKLGIGMLSPELRRYERLIEHIFDMFLKPSGRPTSKKMEGVLNFYLTEDNPNAKR